MQDFVSSGVLFLFLAISGCSSGETVTLPDQASTALRSGTAFEVFSLDPAWEEAIVKGEYEGPQFHGWAILGSTVIEDVDTRNTLLDALDKAVADKDPSRYVECFWPRHGIRVIHDGKQYDFLICFQCERAPWFVDGDGKAYIGMTASPKPAFDKVLTEAGVPLPEK